MDTIYSTISFLLLTHIQWLTTARISPPSCGSGTASTPRPTPSLSRDASCTRPLALPSPDASSPSRARRVLQRSSPQCAAHQARPPAAGRQPRSPGSTSLAHALLRLLSPPSPRAPPQAQNPSSGRWRRRVEGRRGCHGRGAQGRGRRPRSWPAPLCAGCSRRRGGRGWRRDGGAATGGGEHVGAEADLPRCRGALRRRAWLLRSTSGLSIYKGFDLKNYSFLYSIPDENVQEIKIREREGLYKVPSS